MIIKAKELNATHIGKKVRFSCGPSYAQTMYDDILRSVRHHRQDPDALSALGILNAKKTTEIWLMKSRWQSNNGILNSREVGLEVDPEMDIDVDEA